MSNTALFARVVSNPGVPRAYSKPGTLQLKLNMTSNPPRFRKGRSMGIRKAKTPRKARRRTLGLPGYRAVVRARARVRARACVFARVFLAHASASDSHFLQTPCPRAADSVGNLG